MAEDGVDLARSRSLLILPVTAGAIELPGTLSAAAAEVGEIRAGQWRGLASLPLKAQGDQRVLSIPPAFRREMLRVVSPAQP